ncbi:anthranilate phosphoribosyltransferase TrpD [Eubacterium limosum]|nr:anthranilate phosphoribosyltransferase TrpD [Eubacterium limosum]
MEAVTMKEYGQVITGLINRENLTKEESKEMFMEILGDRQTPMQQGAFLAALSAKGPTAAEVAGSFEAIYEIDTCKVTPQTAVPVVENCGTGMDTFKTFNISTVAGIIAAADGVPMAKHGSRALTSVCGTIDAVEALGVDVDCCVDVVKASIETAGIGIFNGMSPEVHPTALGRVLSQISFGSVLNISASLANPALPKYAVRGVYSLDMLEFVPDIMHEIGYEHALVVYGEAGSGCIDEASTVGPTHVAELMPDGTVKRSTLTPESLGIEPGCLDELAPWDSVDAAAQGIVRILKGASTPTRANIVCLNSALILYVAGKADSIQEGYMRSHELIASGKAYKALEKWVATQNRNPQAGLAKLKAVAQAAEV